MKRKNNTYLNRIILACMSATLLLFSACGETESSSAQASASSALPSSSADSSAESSRAASSSSVSSSGPSSSQASSSTASQSGETSQEQTPPPPPSDSLLSIDYERVESFVIENPATGAQVNVNDSGSRTDIIEALNNFTYSGETEATGSGQIRIVITMSEGGGNYDLLISENGIEYNGGLFEGTYFSSEWIAFWLSYAE